MKSDFPELLTTYFNQYLELQKGASVNTISSYRDAFLLLFTYYGETYRIAPSGMSFQNISVDSITGFCHWLETIRKSSVRTRNLRLAAVHSFFRYVEMQEPSTLGLCREILDIPMKKCEQASPVYLSAEEIKLLFAEPNTKNKKGIRDLAIITLLYDTGARVSELTGLKMGDIRLDTGTATVKIHGKGRKQRVVPISEPTANIIKTYYKSNERAHFKTETYLFTNSRGDRLTRPGINHILDKYVNLARGRSPDKFKIKVTAHVLRHSKATNLLLNDVNLVYIRDFLGHSSVVTTERYAKTNPEFLRRAIEKNAQKYMETIPYYNQQEKDNLVEFLRTFGK